MRRNFWSVYLNEPWLLTGIAILLFAGVIVLNSLAPYLFPNYFIYIVTAIIAFIIFSHISIDVLSLFKWHIYILSIMLLLLPLGIGQITRGVVRWVELGGLTFQPTEIVRPFLFLFFAFHLTSIKLNTKNLIQAGALIILPVFLIVVQPSLGVAILTSAGVFGVFLSLDFKKIKIIYASILGLLTTPILWFILQDYQKQRILNILNPANDPTGAGYNRIQSIIAVGSGQVTGRGLGEGIQTQLAFLPERHTDFIFASIAEEFGIFGTSIIVIVTFFILYRIIVIMENSKSIITRAFVSGVLFSYFIQIFIHMAMNMGIAPITGLPLPLVSAGGSSLIATMITLGLVIQSKRYESI